MAANRKLDPIADVAAAVVANDPAVRERMQRLVNALLSDAEHTLKFGTATERASLMKMVVPALLRSMQSAGADAAEQSRREAMERIYAQMRGGG
jgi:hypothetical protein